MHDKLALIMEIIKKALKSIPGADMQYILFLVMLTYSLPLIGIAFSAYVSDGFSLENKFVYITSAISVVNSNHLRDIFGNMLVPLVTASSIKVNSADPNQPVPAPTKRLFTVFIVLFITSSILYGVVTSKEDNLKKFGEDIYTSFKEITSASMKETLMYVALTIGITIKR